MVDPIVLTIFIGAIASSIIPILLRLPANRKRIQKRDTRRLIESKKGSSIMRWIMLGIGILGTQPFVALLVLFRNTEIVTSVLCMMLAVLFAGLGGFWFFVEMYVLESAELQLRSQSGEVKLETKDSRK